MFPSLVEGSEAVVAFEILGSVLPLCFNKWFQALSKSFSLCFLFKKILKNPCHQVSGRVASEAPYASSLETDKLHR